MDTVKKFAVIVILVFVVFYLIRYAGSLFAGRPSESRAPYLNYYSGR